MTYPKPVTVHLYEFDSLHDGMNARTIQDSGLTEYDRFTAHNTDELETLWHEHCTKTRTCCIVEDNEDILNSGVSSAFETSMVVTHHYERLAKTQAKAETK